MLKVLLIEDEAKAVMSLKKGLEDYQIEVDYALDGRAGYALALQKAYDVIISDIVMPHMTGAEVVSRLRDRGVNTPILLLTALGATEDKVRGLENGADDYLVKPFEFRELLARIHALARRFAPAHNAGATPTLLRFADMELDLDTRTFSRAGRSIELTPKEQALIEYFIKNQGRVISKAEIAEKVWDIHFDTGTNVIEVYINYLRNKVDKPFPTKLIHTVFGSGYVLREG